MESKLTKQDLELIDKLVEDKLKHYNLIAPIQQEQPKEKVKERFNISVHPFDDNINDNKITIYYNDGELSTQQANVLVTQIKALLQTL